MLGDAKDEITAFADFPEAHWRMVWSTNPSEGLNKEVKRRTDMIGIFPNPPRKWALDERVTREDCVR